jgi:hypothetical protein
MVIKPNDRSEKQEQKVKKETINFSGNMNRLHYIKQNFLPFSASHGFLLVFQSNTKLFPFSCSNLFKTLLINIFHYATAIKTTAD